MYWHTVPAPKVQDYIGLGKRILQIDIDLSGLYIPQDLPLHLCQ